MTEGKTEEQLSTDLASLEEMLPATAGFIKGAANSTSKKLRSVAAGILTKPVTIKDPVGTYTFEDPIFVRRIRFYGPQPSALRTALSVTTVGIDGTELKHSLLESGKGTADHFCVLAPQRVVAAMHIRVNGSKSVSVTHIAFTGFRFAEVEEMNGRLTQALNLRNTIDRTIKEHTATFKQTEVKLSALRSAIAEEEEAKTTLETEISVLEVTKSQADAALGALRSAQAEDQKTLTTLETKVTAARNNEDQLKTETKSLNEDIAGLKRELKALENDRSVISDEYRDYVREGRSQAALYASIASICLLASLVGAALLVVGAAHYLDPRVTTTSEAYALFIQRLPFTAAFAATIGLLLKLAEYLIKGVYSIHQSRLTLARLLVLAKDTVYSSAADLDVSDADRLKERVRLKVDLLRQYLSAELGAGKPVKPEVESETTTGDGDDEDPEEDGGGRTASRTR